MKTINLSQEFDFDSFMKTRGWSSILRIAIWVIITVSVLVRMLVSKM